jgi:hypothetical protein
MMKALRVVTVLALLGLLAGALVHFLRRSEPPAAPIRHSGLWGEAGERWDAAGRLPDFSFAGYGMGQRPIPHPPVAANVRDFGAKGDGVSDDSRAFLEAIAAVKRGAVAIPQGRYLLTQVLRIDRPGLVLRGEGPGRTTLYFPKSLREILGPAPASHGDNGYWSWGGGFIWLTGEDRGTRIADVVEPAKRGDHRLVLSTTDGLAAGQLVRLVQYATDGSLWEHLHTRPVEPGPDLVKWAHERLVDFVTPILAVEQTAIIIERPLRVDVRPEWKPTVFSHEPTVTEVGIEELSIEFAPVPYAGHLVEPGNNGIFLEHIHQFWICDVEILDADSGIVSDGPSCFGTISGVRLANDRRAGEITGHHGISLEGPNDVLVTGFRIETRFTHDLTVDALSNGNVFSKGRGVDLCFDHHTGAPYENLFTDLDVGPGTRLWVNGGPAAGWGPHSAARETFWNIRATDQPMPIPAYPQLTIIAMSGVNRSEYSDHWIEAIDPSFLQPQDLHLAQLRRRLSRVPQ